MSATKPQYTISVKIQRNSLIKALFLQLRPKQWTKNLLVLAAGIFAGTFLEYRTMVLSLLAFICFSFMASTIYIINDIVDIEKDRLHPEKSKRPLASGALSIPVAITLGVLLFSITVVLGFYISLNLGLILLFYFIMNLFYSLNLKHVVIIDVMIIATGFVLRALAGVVAVGLWLTPWFFLCTLLLSLFLALGKRRHELELFREDLKKQRKVLENYSIKLLDQLISIVTGLTIMSYSLYAATVNPYMMFTVPLVIYGVFRYLYLIHMHNIGGKPEDILISDKHILFTVILYGISVVIIKSFL